IPIGIVLYVINFSATNAIDLKDASGAILKDIGGATIAGATVPPLGVAFVKLNTNTTQAGAWSVTDHAAYATGIPTLTDGSGAGLTFTGVSVGYTVNGNMVDVYGRLTYPTTSNTNNAKISGLPFTVAAPVYGSGTFVAYFNGQILLLVNNGA